MKILLITSKKLTGLNYHRQIVPFQGLTEFDVKVCEEWSDEITDEFLKDFHCVSFLRNINLNGKTKEIAERIHKLGLKIHFDIDDYWKLPSSHPFYKAYAEQKVGEQTIEALEVSDFVTTTTEYLAFRIRDFNDSVYILPNAINPNEKQWELNNIESEKVRFGYIAGVHHQKDVLILEKNFKKVWEANDLYNKFQLIPAGFNLNKYSEERIIMNPYYRFVEQIFTDNYKYIKNKDYKEYLQDNNPQNTDLFINEPYRRLWGTDTFNYAKLYDYIDVSLVPLEQNMFSSCKSELKLIESGFKKKAVIVSNVNPYNILINKENCLSILPSRNHIEWFTNMRKLVLNPNMVKDLGEALYEAVKVKYHVDTVNKERKQIFETCV